MVEETDCLIKGYSWENTVQITSRAIPTYNGVYLIYLRPSTIIERALPSNKHDL